MKIRVSNSKLRTYRRCPRRYRFKYVEKLEPRKRSVQLERGSWIHALLEAYYTGEDWKAVHKEFSKRFFDYDEETREDLGDLPNECKRIMLSYIRYWRDIDQHYRVIDAELDEYVTLPDGITLQIIVDLVLEEKRTGKLWAWDHKTRKSFESYEGMVLDPQLTLYFMGLEILGYKPMAGVVYNEIRTKAPVIPEQLASGGLSQRKNMDTDAATYLREIKRLGLDPGQYRDMLLHLKRNEHERFFRRISLPKDPPMVKIVRRETVQTAQEIMDAEAKDRFPRSFDAKQCKWDCDFKDLCLAEYHGADYEPIVRMNFRRRGQMD